MEVFSNETEIKFTNTKSANKAKEIAIEVIAGLKHKYRGYLRGIKNTIQAFSVEENALVLPKVGGELAPADLLEIMTEVVKAIAEQLSTENFTIFVFGADTYTEGSLEGQYENGTLEIKSTYWPMGYSEEIDCPECGEGTVWVDDFDPSKTYYCPECGEEIDLTDYRPEIKNITLKIV